MKRILSLILAFTIMLILCACQGDFGDVILSQSIAIPQDGIIERSVIQQLKTENAIGIFTGVSGEFSYEWKIFGSDIDDPKTVNLQVQLMETPDGDIGVLLSQKENFGFFGMLSISLLKQWEAQTATAYAGDVDVGVVSITGSGNTVLNISLDGAVSEFKIRANPLPEDAGITQKPEETDPTVEQNQSTVDETTSAVNNTQETIPETTAPPVETTVPAETKDKYNTDPIPEGKPNPVEPENQNVNKGAAYTCTFSIECSTILNNLSQLDSEKLEMVPSDGVILKKTTVTFYEGESVFDVLQRVCKEQKIHLESSWTPMYNSAYIEGIHNLYEFDCGSLSGWMYRVNGWYPNYGASRYQLKEGDLVEWRFTCDLGNDIGDGYAAGG